MIKVGASTANLYPMETEKALDTLLGLGVKTLEIFLNTESETHPAFVESLSKQVKSAGANIVAVHPYTSVAEPYLFFTDYKRRFQDALALYEKLFQVCKTLEASFLIMHGDRLASPSSLPQEQSICRFEQIYDAGQNYGVTLLQENVCRNRSADPSFLLAMRQQLGTKARFVLDFKQALRSGLTVETVMRAMGEHIAHIHISDHDSIRDCLIPGQGKQNFRSIFRHLHSLPYNGAVMLELYRNNYQSPEELIQGISYLENIICE